MKNRIRPAVVRVSSLGVAIGLALISLGLVAPTSFAAGSSASAFPWAPVEPSTPVAESAGVDSAVGGSAVGGSAVTVNPLSVGQPTVVDPSPAPAPDATAVADPVVVQAPAGPQLSIAIDNGRTSTTTGDKLDYVITVSNLGTTDIDGLLVNQTLPAGMTFGSADSSGTADAGKVSWTVDLKATETATLHTSMTVTATPAELLRLATVACASISADGPPIVCASDSDQLPAGAAAEAAASALAGDATTPASGISSWWYLGGGIGVVVVVAALAVLLVRRRAAPPTEGT